MSLSVQLAEVAKRRRAVAYWQRQLADAQPLDLAGGEPDPPTPTFARRRIDAELPQEFHGFRADAGQSPFDVAAAAFVLLMRRYGGADDVCVGSWMRNLVALRVRIVGAESFRQLVARVAEVVGEARDHQDVPLEELSRQSYPSFVLNGRSFGRICFSQEHVLRRSDAFDLSVELTGSSSRWEFNLDRVPPDVAERMTGQFQTLLAAALADPDLAVDRLPTPAGAPERRESPAPARAREVEGELARIWADVLGRRNVGVDEDFFSLGGHSLLALRLTTRIRDDLGSSLTIMDVFDHPTVREMAAAIRELP